MKSVIELIKFVKNNSLKEYQFSQPFIINGF